MCGIFAAWNVENASHLVYLGLYALQHRGQESAGIVAVDGARFMVHKQQGLVADNFPAKQMSQLTGDAAIGHVRYSTAGGDTEFNTQPIHVRFNGTELAIAHNGNLVNAAHLRRQLNQQGAIFQSTMDTELIVHMMARAQQSDVKQRFITALNEVRGAYSLLLITPDQLLIARDPYGYRPLSIGTYRGGHVVASESCAFDLIGATFLREVNPGEVISINRQGVLQSVQLAQQPKSQARCVFEHVYFARPDSSVFREDVYQVRKAMGAALAREHPVAADMVVPVPDSGIPAALGFAQSSGIPFDLGLIRNHYVHRTFIEPDPNIRHFGVRVKLNPMRSLIRDKRLVVIDDSIVRGTTSKKIVSMLREAGAKEVHMRVASPPIIGSCYFGIDTPSTQELIAANHDVAAIQKFLQVDSLGYLSREGMLAVLQEPKQYCTGCFTGNYPETVDPELKQRC